MINPRARKKAKTSAERRLETLQGCHTNKFADIGFSKFQLGRAAAGDPMQVVPVKARSDALVQDWRDVDSYEPSGAPGYTEEQTSLHAGSLRIAWARVAIQIAHWRPWCLLCIGSPHAVHWAHSLQSAKHSTDCACNVEPTG